MGTDARPSSRFPVAGGCTRGTLPASLSPSLQTGGGIRCPLSGLLEPAIKAALGPSSHLLPRLGSGCVRSAGAQFPLAGGAQGLVVGRAVEPRATANQFGHKSQLSQPSLFHLITSLSEHSLPVHTNPPHPRRGCLTIHGVATPVSSTSSLSLPT